jgi:GABA(A) receptor-associated protein
MPPKRNLRKEAEAMALARSEDEQFAGKIAEVLVKDEPSAKRKSKAEDMEDDFSTNYYASATSTSQLAEETDEAAEDVSQATCASGGETTTASALNNSMELLKRSDSASSHMQPDAHMKRRIMGAAATMGGTAGMLVSGPLAGAALGATAAYVSVREGAAGSLTRQAGAAYVKAVDRATDAYIKAADRTLEEGRQHLAKDLESVAASTALSVPAPVRAGLRRLSTQLQPAAAQRSGGVAHKEEATRMLAKYPDRVPVVCTRSLYSELPQIEKSKFAVPGTMPCGEFKYIVHKNIVQALGNNLGAEQTIYIFVNGIVPKTTTPMSELYEKFQATDGFLYVTYGAENTLG